MKKKIFVTGAGGYLGTELIKKLIQSKNVEIFGMIYKNKPIIKADNLHFFKGDINIPSTYEKYLNHIDEVYHLVAYTKPWSKNKNTYLKINTLGTENIIKFSIKHKVKRILITSTAGIFGYQKNDKLIDENNNKENFFFTEYEKTKFKAIQLAQSYLQKIDIIFVSPTRIYGPGTFGISNVATRLIYMILFKNHRLIPGDGTIFGNYVYIDDVVNGHILAIEKGKNGQNYILGGDNISYNKFFEIVKKIGEIKRKMFFIPIPFILVTSYIMLVIAKIFHKEPLITPSFVKKYSYNCKVNTTKAQKELGYKFTPFETGIKKTIQWIYSQNKII